MYESTFRSRNAFQGRSVRYIHEAKSLNDPSAAVARMRYGIGQLFDYGVRYRAEIGRAQPVLAFGAMPSRDVGWISTILQENGVAFIARHAARCCR